MVISRVAHIALGVPDPERAAAFYRDVFGLSAVGGSSEGVFLACGTSNTFELRLREGDAELDHLALSVRSREALELARERLSEAGAPVADLDLTGTPGLDCGIEN